MIRQDGDLSGRENHYQMEVAPGSGGGHLMWIFGVDGCWLLVENRQEARKNSRECFSGEGKKPIQITSSPFLLLWKKSRLKFSSFQINGVGSNLSKWHLQRKLLLRTFHLEVGAMNPQLPGPNKTSESSHPSYSEIKTSSLINMMNMCLSSSCHHLITIFSWRSLSLPIVLVMVFNKTNQDINPTTVHQKEAAMEVSSTAHLLMLRLAACNGYFQDIQKAANGCINQIICS